MRKIGRQVHMISTSAVNPRNGEGAFIRLSDGRIAFAYTEFIGATREDDEQSQISVIFSFDEGETWSEKSILFPKPENAINIMSFSFIPFSNGDIGAVYIEKKKDGTDDILFRKSPDDLNSWSSPISCIYPMAKKDYYVINNDRSIILRSGRILLPVARHTIYEEKADFAPGILCFFYSDDNGATWNKTDSEITCPFKADTNGLQEPGLYQLDDSTLWCYIRTGLGCQYKIYSADNGETWTDPEPDLFFSSPCSPMLVKDCCHATIAVFNPIPEHILKDDEKDFWGRTPYVAAVSFDKGKTFEKNNILYIEDDLSNGYCYPAVFNGEDYALIAYYHSNGSDCCLDSTKIIKIQKNEFSVKKDR